MDTFRGPDGTDYDLAHLAAFECISTVTISGEKLEVPVLVLFRDHCYTREMEEGDDESWRIDCNGRKDAVFCPIRWTFSNGLRDLISGLVKGGRCYLTSQSGQYFRVQHSNERDKPPDHGWYVFFSFEKRRKGPGVALSIVSVHPRQTWPSNARGRQNMKFGAALAAYLKGQPQILEALRKEKGPQQGGLPF